MEHIPIAGERHQYCAWPAVTRTPDGTILVSYCRSEEHMGPDGEMRTAEISVIPLPWNWSRAKSRPSTIRHPTPTLRPA